MTTFSPTLFHLSLLLVAGQLGCADTSKDTADNHEIPITYQAGMRDISFTDQRGKDLLMTVWYPTILETSREPDAYEPFTIAIDAYKATAPVVKQAPLVAFSHGFFAIRYQSAFLMEHLAKQGFVVIAVDHPFNTLYDFNDTKTATVLLERPDDLRAAVDHLTSLAQTEGDPLYNMVDTSQYAVMGHSFGSHTASVLGGGTLDYNGLQVYCSNNPDERACDYLGDIQAEDLSGYGGPDPRVIATIPISPGLWYTFGPNGEGLEHVQNPLVIVGTKDDVLEYDTEAIPHFEALPSPKLLFSMENTGHYGMTNICDIASFLSEECIEDGWQPVSEVQRATNTIITAFLRSQFEQTELDLDQLNEDWIEIRSE